MSTSTMANAMTVFSVLGLLLLSLASASTPSSSSSTLYNADIVELLQSSMREFEDVQSEFSLEQAAATALSSDDENTELDILDQISKSSLFSRPPSAAATDTVSQVSAATRSKKVGSKNDDGTEEKQKQKEKHTKDKKDTTAPSSSEKRENQSLADRWFPPFWDPDRSAASMKKSRKEQNQMVVKKTTSQKGKKEGKPKESKGDKQDSEKDDKTNEEVENETTKEGDGESPKNNTTETTEKPSTPTEIKPRNQKGQNPSRTEPPPSNQPPPQIIVMGGPMGHQGSPSGMMTPEQRLQHHQEMQKRATTVAFSQAIAVLLAKGLEIGFMIWATRHLVNRPEVVMPIQHFVFERLNDRFVRDTHALQTALQDPPLGVNKHRWGRIMNKRSLKQPFFKRTNLDQTYVKTAVVVELGNDSQAGGLEWKHLSDVVTFLVSRHRAQAFGSIQEEGSKTARPVDLEIVFKVHSPGGSVATFGLAAAQIERLRREAGVSTTVCVDEYAASGGYMIASQANKLIAAPFATVGSVGVIMETLNFHDMLRQYGVQPMVIKAGNAKNPVTQFGPVTKRDLQLEQLRLEKVHEEFQRFTVQGRPQLKGKESELCNGSIYLGQEALNMNLIDAIMTSDEYLMGRIEAGVRVLRIQRSRQSRMGGHFPSPIDFLPHLWKTRLAPLVKTWSSDPQILSKVVQAGSILQVARHIFLTYLSKSSPPNP